MFGEIHDLHTFHGWGTHFCLSGLVLGQPPNFMVFTTGVFGPTSFTFQVQGREHHCGEIRRRDERPLMKRV